jgi:hypothetical protein
MYDGFAPTSGSIEIARLHAITVAIAPHILDWQARKFENGQQS